MITSNKVIGVLVICVVLTIHMFIKAREALDGRGLLVPFIAYLMVLGIMFFSIMLIWWAVLLIMS